MKNESNPISNSIPPLLENVGNFMQSILLFLIKFLALDKRSLALFRICMGFVIIYDLYTRFLDLEPHYSDDGIFPRDFLFEKPLYLMGGNFILNVHLISGSISIQRVLFGLHFALALLFVVGYHSKLISILLWILQNSIINRTTLTMHGGDFYIRAILFWTMFLPVSDCFSIDSFMKKLSNKSERSKNVNSWQHIYFSGITIAMHVQVSIMYWTSFKHKTGDVWHPKGTATYLALQSDYFRTPIGDFILHNVPFDWLSYMTLGVLFFEGFGFALFMIPIFNSKFRTLGVFGFAMMHIGFWSSLRIEMFGPLCSTVVLMFLPDWFWQQIEKFFIQKSFPKNCGLKIRSDCFKCKEELSNLFWIFGIDCVVSFQPNIQSTQYFELVVDGKSKKENEVAKELRNYSPYLSKIPFIHFFYSFIFTNHSFWMSIHQSHKLQLIQREQNTLFQFVFKMMFFGYVSFYWICYFLIQTMVIWLSLCVVQQNLLNIGDLRSMDWPLAEVYNLRANSEIGRHIWDTSQLYQVWNMFSPSPPLGSWYFMIDGTTQNETHYELFENLAQYEWKGRIYVDSPPSNIVLAFGTHRWFKFYERLLDHYLQKELRYLYTKWICRSWNRKHESNKNETLKRIRFSQMFQQTNLNRIEKDWGTLMFVFEQDC